ncbi:hypothetical protein SLS62_004441 [Diatrype stigma]|uniref:Allergen Asp f 4 n=1 Tax=Diatrype stigma TaxID=117547 RepID=A0AAN9UT81_9PEZI
MHIQKNSVLLLAAMGAGNAAARATHKHRHADLHKARAVGDVVHAIIDGVEVSWANTYDGSNDGGDSAAAVPTSTSIPPVATPPATNVKAAATEYATASETAAAAATSTTAAASSTPSSSSGAGNNADVLTVYTPFCKANKKRATQAEIAYVGNVGSEWGCNQLLVSEDIADQYDYTIKVTGKNTEPWKVVCTNKIGPDGKIDGWYNGNAAVEFTLQPGATQYIAVDANTQGICAAAPGDSIPVDAQGGYASTWFEFDVANESNNGWSGADISSIQAQAAGFEVQGMQACHSDICSAIYDSGLGPIIDNAFDIAKKLADGLGLNIPSGKTQIELTLGYSG